MGVAISATSISQLVCSCERDESNVTEPKGQTFTVDITRYPELSAAGGITQLTISGLNDGEMLFVSRLNETTFAVFSSVCTHAGAIIDLPEAAPANCICPRHLAEFSRNDGSVVRQPVSGSATNLRRYAATFDAQTNILTIRT